MQQFKADIATLNNRIKWAGAFVPGKDPLSGEIPSSPPGNGNGNGTVTSGGPAISPPVPTPTRKSSALGIYDGRYLLNSFILIVFFWTWAL